MKIKDALIAFGSLISATLVVLLTVYIADVCSEMCNKSETFAYFMYIAGYAFLGIILAAQFFRIYIYIYEV